MGLSVYPEGPLPDFWLELAKGDVPNHSRVLKFGRDVAVGSTYAPVSIGKVYRTPQVSGATALRVKAGDANDTAAGSGAREITIQGLDETGALVNATLATAGTSASAATSETFIRLFRAFVSASGTYATQTTGSHAADIVIENSAGTEDWLTIDSTDIPKGQSEVAVFTIPLGFTGYINATHISVTATKSVTVSFFKRENILETAAPYSAMRLQEQWGGVDGQAGYTLSVPSGPYPALTDIGFMAKAPVSSEADVNFEIILIAD